MTTLAIRPRANDFFPRNSERTTSTGHCQLAFRPRDVRTSRFRRGPHYFHLPNLRLGTIFRSPRSTYVYGYRFLFLYPRLQRGRSILVLMGPQRLIYTLLRRLGRFIQGFLLFH